MAEEEQDQDESVEETGGSKKKLIIIAGGVVLLLILAGAGLYFTGFFEGEKPAVAEGPASSEGGASKDDSAEADSESEEGGEAVEVLYHALTPPFMVNFPDGNIKVIKISMSIMANNDNVIDAVKMHDPVIRNNVLMLLSNQDPETLKTAEGKTQLQSVVKDEINKVLAERKVSSTVVEVFFTDMVMQ